jgi:hypothetical protein
MKALYVLASLTAIALSGCAYYSTPPVAYTTPYVVTSPSVAVSPAYVAPSGTVIVR